VEELVCSYSSYVPRLIPSEFSNIGGRDLMDLQMVAYRETAYSYLYASVEAKVFVFRFHENFEEEKFFVLLSNVFLQFLVKIVHNRFFKTFCKLFRKKRKDA
jgi:hypothetical protein